MKTNRTKLFITVLSVAMIGLSSTALQAQDTDQVRDRVHMGSGIHMDGVQLSEQLQMMIHDFRANREALMEHYREVRLAHREEMALFFEEMKALRESDPEAWEAAWKAKRVEVMDVNRETFGALREQRREMRKLGRAIREQIRGGAITDTPEG